METETVSQWAEELAAHMGYGAPAVVDIGGGRTLRATVEIDEDTRVDDSDAYGRVAWVTRAGDNGYRSDERPDGFDGRARKLWAMGDAFWWQPHADVEDEHLAELADLVADLVAFGFKGVVLELCEGLDGYQRPIVKHHASLWGIDSLEGEYGATVVADLIEEVLAEEEEAEE